MAMFPESTFARWWKERGHAIGGSREKLAKAAWKARQSYIPKYTEEEITEYHKTKQLEEDMFEAGLLGKVHGFDVHTYNLETRQYDDGQDKVRATRRADLKPFAVTDSWGEMATKLKAMETAGEL